MNILVTGAGSQVGLALTRLLTSREVTFVALDRRQLDITDAAAIDAALAEHQPQYLINTDGLFDATLAQQDETASFALNRDGPALLAQACAARGIGMVQLSSERIFDGTKAAAYLENDTPHPLSVLGESQWAGEQAVRAACPQHLIVRTSWVFGPDGDNPLTRTLAQLTDRAVLNLCNDQQGCPTPAADLARVIFAMLEQVDCQVDPPLWGTYHYVGSDRTDWRTFVETVVKAAKSYVDVSVEQLAETDAVVEPEDNIPRPVNAELAARKVLATFGIKQQPWRRGIQDALKMRFENHAEDTQ
ncbi:SDR family oxidoreductase [Saccharospirillum mangrovi]|uniref:SDR family oxidoreductase n=1 Tax=Saccharospirillum mangrovi TaxID=2161747 RepID=UPI000D35E212|nr:sugar nucleotide-binding protein [Saccharospirillum mangrovi]